MEADFLIRSASPTDCEAIANLNAVVLRLHREHEPSLFKPANLSDLTDRIRTRLQEPETHIWLADAKGKLVGHICVVHVERPENSLLFTRRYLEIEEIVVSPNWQRRGIGTALLATAVEEARSAGVSAVELSCWQFNNTAQEAFRHFGFLPKWSRFRMHIS